MVKSFKKTKYGRINAQKIAYMATKYREVSELASNIHMAPLEFYSAYGLAKEEGFIKVDKDNLNITETNVGATWVWDDSIERIKSAIVYSIEDSNSGQVDVHDDELVTEWCAGLPAQDVYIAISELVKDKVLYKYTIENTTKITNDEMANALKMDKGEEFTDEYDFYTLAKNQGKNWGLKRFPDQTRVKVLKDDEDDEDDGSSV